MPLVDEDTLRLNVLATTDLAIRIDDTKPLWGILSAFNIQGTVFYDQGKIWSEYISYEEAIHRENAGMGIEWTMDTASLFQVPLKIEIAFPLNDPDYKIPQFIFLGVLTGS